MVDHLIRDLANGDIERDEASSRLARIVSSGHDRPRWAVTVGNGVMGSGVGVMLGGDWVVTLVAFVAAVAIDVTQRQLTRRRLPAFYQQAAGGLSPRCWPREWPPPTPPRNPARSSRRASSCCSPV